MAEKNKDKETKAVVHSGRLTGLTEWERDMDRVPAEVHADKVKASFKNGILEVRMPKTEEAKAKEIKVKVE